MENVKQKKKKSNYIFLYKFKKKENEFIKYFITSKRTIRRCKPVFEHFDDGFNFCCVLFFYDSNEIKYRDDLEIFQSIAHKFRGIVAFYQIDSIHENQLSSAYGLQRFPILSIIPSHSHITQFKYFSGKSAFSEIKDSLNSIFNTH